jgi:hypothetical protein
MRVNIYAQERTREIQMFEHTIESGWRKGDVVYAVRFVLVSPDELHHAFNHDERSGITFWFDTRAEAVEYFSRVK